MLVFRLQVLRTCDCLSFLMSLCDAVNMYTPDMSVESRVFPLLPVKTGGRVVDV